MKLCAPRPVEKLGFPLAAVTVVPIQDPVERMRWDRTMDECHYLGFRGMFGESLRHVAMGPDGQWLALLGWCAAALKVGARDRWIGWLSEQRLRRLPLVVNNARFLVLGPYRVPNLASRVLALSTQRLSQDMEVRYGHPVLLAETFVDPLRFRGSCYRAAGWEVAGETRGFARTPDGWEAHGQPKIVLLRPVAKQAVRDLTGLDEPVSWHLPPPQDPPPPAPKRLRSLYDHFNEIPEFRAARGIRHSLPTVLSLVTAGRLPGAHGIKPIAKFAASLDEEQLREVRAFRSPKTGRLTPPSQTTFHRILARIDPAALDQAVRDFAAAQCPPGGGLALDGKAPPRACRTGDTPNRRMLVGALHHDSGVILGQTESDCAGGEIRAARQLIRELPVAGRVLTLDALHTCRETAQLIVDEGADYVLPAKNKRSQLWQDLKAFDPTFDTAQHKQVAKHTIDKGHGRIDQRTCTVIPLSEQSSDTLAPLPGRRQAFRIVCRRTAVKRTAKPRKTSEQVVYGVTSLSSEQAGTTEILALNRGHWGIENRLHYVRDVTFGEDQSRIRTGHLHRNLACLGNAAISIVRLHGKFPFQSEVGWHYARCQGEAIREVTRAF